jgi:Tat protein translocase TatB subunit
MNIFSNIGITELVVILLLALLVVGPERLPELSRKLAKTLRDVRQAYENITKDLGPELMSIQETTREIRDSVDSVRSIPKDMVGSVIKAADLEDTVKDLKGVQQSIEDAGKGVTQARQALKKPLDETLQSARGALQPATAEPPQTVTASEVDTVPVDGEAAAEEPASEAVAEAEQEQQPGAADATDGEQEGADG